MDYIAKHVKSVEHIIDEFVASVAQNKVSDDELFEEMARAARNASMHPMSFLDEVRTRVTARRYNEVMLGSMSPEARKLFKVDEPALV